MRRVPVDSDQAYTTYDIFGVADIREMCGVRLQQLAVAGEGGGPGGE